ncbi:hypothetical protein BG015_009071 [Linnemannia schmuckeri]|uniref:ADP-ribosylation factor n=1 Tax=Linnemannia schmuckeri TaxID=64567 RepID=A0A9P5RW10_9FUNG|nr:hypothetical protein BG015_009071 [Linnemannia schmuckeri]
MLGPIRESLSAAHTWISDTLWPQQEVLMMGDSGGGKTTALYRLIFGKEVATLPTYVYNVESLTIQGVRFKVLDFGGQMGSFWRHYVSVRTAGIIWMVDSTNEDELETLRTDPWRVLWDYNRVSKETVLLVFANHQDRLNALSVVEVKDKLELETRARGRRWHIQGSSATTGEGLVEGMEWMATQLSKAR